MAEGRLSVGNVEILALNDNENTALLSDIFPDVSAEAWAPYKLLYPEIFPDPDTWSAHFHCYLLRSQGRNILVDTGVGSNATNPGTVAAMLNGVDGRLIAQLQSAGVKPEDVDTVLLTHLHPDHVGWNLSGGGRNPRPTFPKARYLAHKSDWEAFSKQEVRSVFPFPFWDETLEPLQRLGVLDLLSGERSLTSEVTAIHTPGHTPGSMSVAVTSGGQRASILGDVLHCPVQLQETDWRFSFDMDPSVAKQTRRRMVERAEAEGAVVAVCHHRGFGKVVRVQGRRFWRGI